MHLWRTRYGYWYRVDHTGTHPLGKHPTVKALGASNPAADSPLEAHLAELIAGRSA